MSTAFGPEPQQSTKFERDELKAKVAAKRDEQRFKILCEKLPLVFFTLGHEFTVTSLNAYGFRELAYDKKDLIGQKLIALIHEDDRDIASMSLAAVANKDSLSSWEFRLRKKDGSTMWVSGHSHLAAITSDHSEILLICKDVTERKLAENRVLDYQEQLRRLTVVSFFAEERERRRIAIGLHDDVGQNLAVAMAQLDILGGENTADELKCRVKTIRKLLDETIHSTRSLTFELSSPVLYELGLEHALRGLANKMARESRVCVRFDTDDKPRAISKNAEVLLYRTVRELLHNIEKHANATNARISIQTLQDDVQVSVEDDGVGMKYSEIDVASEGFGLFSIREHLNSLGGHMEIEGGREYGTHVIVTVPGEARNTN